MIALGTGLSVSWTRVIMGVQSLDQAIFGCFIGLWLAFTLEFSVRKWMMHHIMNLHKNEKNEFLPLGVLAILVSVGIFILIGIAIYIYYYCQIVIDRLPSVDVAKWTTNIKKDCNLELTYKDIGS